MKVYYLKATGLVLEFDAEETKFGIKVLECILSLAKDMADESKEDDQFVFDLEAVHGDILEEEYASVN